MGEMKQLRDWMSIGSGTRDELDVVSDKIDEKWPGRYDFNIAEPEEVGGLCRLRVRHRDCPSDEDLMNIS